MTDAQLIARAASVIEVRKHDGVLIGDVGAAVLTDRGDLFVGVCADTGSNAICAEQAAIMAMLTAGQSRIARMVATWKDKVGAVHVIAPCGNCRQFAREVDPGNLDTQVILDADHAVSLRELLPYHDSWNKQPR